MDLRKSDSESAKEKLTPDAFKSDSTRAGQTVTGKLSDAASYLPGQGKPIDHLNKHTADRPLTHDAGRQGPFSQLSHTVQPDQTKTMGDSVGEMGDGFMSAVTPESQKGVAQRATDAGNPDRYGSDLDGGAGKPGLVQQAKETIQGIIGGGTGSQTGHGHPH